MKPTELHIYDFDGSLYDSPRPRVDTPSWWYSARSLKGYGPPGFDKKWILAAVLQARRSVGTPWVRTALLTGRPQHSEMEQVLRAMLRSADLPFDIYRLKAVWPSTLTHLYKAAEVQRWLLREPTIRKVVFYDDEPVNLEAVGEVALRLGREYVPILTPGVT